jgi:hypothetical protein
MNHAALALAAAQRHVGDLRSSPTPRSCIMNRSMRIACLAMLAGTCLAGEVRAQAASCPPPLKLAAGACVKSCPGGYEDRGSECVYRNLSR